MKQTHRNLQEGLVLVTALVLLVVLTIVAVVAMRTTTLDLRMTSNNMLKTRAFENSETARRQVALVLEDHSQSRDWSGTLPAGMTVKDTTRMLYGQLDTATLASELGNYDSTKLDLEYSATADATGGALDVSADLYVTRLYYDCQSLCPMGSNAAGPMVGFIHYDVRSEGTSKDGAKARTGANVRVRNIANF